SGNPGAQERCSTDGTWVEESCDAWKLCAADACRAICGMTSVPADPTVCMLPIADGVNNGEWWYWSAETSEVPTYVVVRTGTRFGGYAEIRPAPGEDWPFMWRLGASDIIATYFRLDQFDSYRHPALGYRVRTAGVQSASASGPFIVIRGPTDFIGSCIRPAAPTWTTD